MHDPYKTREDLENDLMEVDMCLLTAIGEDRENKLRLKWSILESIRKIDEKIGRNGSQRKFVEEDNRHG